jgi:hypothetical protein
MATPSASQGGAYAAVAAPPSGSWSLAPPAADKGIRPHAPIGPPSPSVGVVGQRGFPPGSYAAAAEQQRQAEQQQRRFEEHPHFQQPSSSAQGDPPPNPRPRGGAGFEPPQGRRYEQFPAGPRAAFANLEGFGGGAEDTGLISELMSSLLQPEQQGQAGRRGPYNGSNHNNGPGLGTNRQGFGGAQEGSVSGGNESLEGLCVVCWERKHACVAVPCGHRSLCIPCKEALQQSNADRDCPICRSAVNHWVAIPQG